MKSIFTSASREQHTQSALVQRHNSTEWITQYAKVSIYQITDQTHLNFASNAIF